MARRLVERRDVKINVPCRSSCLERRGRARATLDELGNDSPTRADVASRAVQIQRIGLNKLRGVGGVDGFNAPSCIRDRRGAQGIRDIAVQLDVPAAGVADLDLGRGLGLGIGGDMEVWGCGWCDRD